MNDYKKTQKELTELNHDGNEDRDEHGNDTSEQSKLTEKEKTYTKEVRRIEKKRPFYLQIIKCVFSV